MCRHCAIMASQLAQSPIKQREMHRFVGSYMQPVIGKFAREFGAEPPDQIKGKVDRDKFDMSKGVEHCDPRAF